MRVVFFVALTALAVTAQSATNCRIPDDYLPVFGACSTDGSSRPKSYTLKPSAVSTACIGPSTIDLGETVPCTCSLSNMNTILSAPQCMGKNISSTNDVGCTLPSNTSLSVVRATLFNVSASCACTSSDLGYTYTSCVNGSRTMVAFFNTGCSADQPGSIALPRPKSAPCALRCPAGEFLAPPNTVCAKCPAGTVSFPGLQLPPPYAELPASSQRTCSTQKFSMDGSRQEGNCTVFWRPCEDKLCFRSGQVDDVDGDSVTTELSLPIRVLTFPATISFDAMTMALPGVNEFELTVDNKRVLSLTGVNGWTSMKHTIRSEGQDGMTCIWSIAEDYCLEPNQLTPFRASSFLSTDSTLYVARIVAVTDPCSASGFAVASLKIGVVDPVNNKFQCTQSTIIANAAKANLRGIVFVADGSLVGSSTSIPSDASSLIVGSLSLAHGTELYGKLLASSGKEMQAKIRFNEDPGVFKIVSFRFSRFGRGGSKLDQAYIRNVRVSGVRMAVSNCELCPPGTTSLPGSSSCQACPVNTFAAQAGSDKCEACPALHGSPAGSSSCLEIPSCGPADYVRTRSICRLRPGAPTPSPSTAVPPTTAVPETTTSAPANSSTTSNSSSTRRQLQQQATDDLNSTSAVPQPPPTTAVPATATPARVISNPDAKSVLQPDDWIHNITFALTQPPLCDAARAAGAPTPLQVPCGECDYGAFLDEMSGQCVMCGSGEIATHKEIVVGNSTERQAHKSCQFCPNQFYPAKKLWYRNFNSLEGVFPEAWRRQCTSCLGSGWTFSYHTTMPDREGVDVLVVGRGVMPGASATLSIDFETAFAGDLYFYYFYQLDSNFGSHDASGVTVTFDIVDAVTNRTALAQSDRLTALDLSIAEKERKKVAFSLAVAGKYRAVWIFTNNQAKNVISFGIDELFIDNTLFGGSESCRPCPPGYSCAPGTDTAQKCPAGTRAPQVSSGMSSYECVSCPFLEAQPLAGQTTCRPCGPGTLSTDGKLCRIGAGCQVIDQAAQLQGVAFSKPTTVRWERQTLGNLPRTSFDLSHFETNHFVPVGDFTLNVSLCSPERMANTCTGPNDLPTFGCGASTQASSDSSSLFALGHNLGAEAFRDSRNNTLGVKVTIEGGACAQDNSRTVSTTLWIYCDPNVPTHEYRNPSSVTGVCAFNATMASRWACPLCTNESFVMSETRCSGTPRTKSRLFSYADTDGRPMSRPMCIGGEPIPKSFDEECAWAELQIEARFNTFWALVLMILAVILILLMMNCYTYCSKRSLSKQYADLQEEKGQLTGDAEMTPQKAGAATTNRPVTYDDEVRPTPGPSAPPAVAPAVAPTTQPAAPSTGTPKAATLDSSHAPQTQTDRPATPSASPSSTPATAPPAPPVRPAMPTAPVPSQQ